MSQAPTLIKFKRSQLHALTQSVLLIRPAPLCSRKHGFLASYNSKSMHGTQSRHAVCVYLRFSTIFFYILCFVRFACLQSLRCPNAPMNHCGNCAKLTKFLLFLFAFIFAFSFICFNHFVSTATVNL